MLYSEVKKQVSFALNYANEFNISVLSDVILNLSTIALSVYDNGLYKMDQKVKLINLVDNKKLNGIVGKITDIYISIDKDKKVDYRYIVDKKYFVNEKNLEAVKEEKHYVIEGYYSDILGFYKTSFHQFYIKKDDESFIATQSVEKATIFTKDEISEISLDFMPQIENITWRFNELQES